MTDEQDRVAMLSDLRKLEGRLEARIITRVEEITKTNHEEMRRHFDIMVERVEAAVKIVAEVNTHHAVVLDDHQMRLKTIERKR